MDKIFENLRENVSEACFEDIVSMVEELLNEGTIEQIKKVHGEPKYSKDIPVWGIHKEPYNKSAELINKVKDIQSAVNVDELNKGDKRRAKYKGTSLEELSKKGKTTKNNVGSLETKGRHNSLTVNIDLGKVTKEQAEKSKSNK